jgi:hypothetical protein
MRRGLHELVERRRSLVARCTAQREQAAQYAAPLQQSLRIADIAVEAGRSVKQHPLLVGTIMTTLAVLGPARTVRWVSKALAAYSLAKNLRAVLRRS